MMRCTMKRCLDAAAGINTRRPVASHFEGNHTCDVGLKSLYLQIEHQFYMLLEIIRDRSWRISQGTRFASLVVSLNLLDATLDLPDVLQVAVQANPVTRA